jgi:hypothetical protein
MSFQLSSFLSGLAYLAFCLLIASFCAWGQRNGASPRFDYKASDNGQSDGEGGGPSPVSPSPKFLSLLSISCLVSLSLFLFMPCGTLPSLLPAAGGASIVVVGLAVVPGFQGGWGSIRRQWRVPFCLGVSLAVLARYARERGVPGELYALDAYVAMPIIGVAEGVEKPGICILAAVSLFALWQALPARRTPAFGENPLAGGEALLAALSAELWMLAAIAFWVCLFFPASFALGWVPGIAVLGGLALNALFFWAKVLAVEWLLKKLREKYPRCAPFHASIPIAFLGLGAWLLLGTAAG